MTLMERFWCHVDKNGPIFKDLGNCWNWIGSLSSGYGRFWIRRGECPVSHRFIWEYLKGNIKEGLNLDHLCRNRRCVNPKHLEVVTGRENTLRGFGSSALNARKTHCKRGHAFSKENTVFITWHKHRIVYRQCRTCEKLRKQKDWIAFKAKKNISQPAKKGTGT